MGQTAHPGRTAGWGGSLLAVSSLVASTLLAGCSSSVAAATTSLLHVADVTVVHPDGSSVGGVDGLRLRAGDLVRTGPAGRAELVTDDRVVYLGSDGAVQVVDGARQQLRHGAVVVNALNGPGLDVEVAGLTVSAPAGAAVRAERSVTVRVGTLAGSVDVASRTGRRLTVSALHQTLVGGDALPDATTPLRLTDDDGEARTVPDLVREDRTLLGLARGIDATGVSPAHIVGIALPSLSSPPALSSHAVRLSAPRGVARSERLLPAVIAAAGPPTGVEQRYVAAGDYRAAGGSWAVVARLVGVDANGVVAALADFERTQAPGHVGSVRAVLAAASRPDGDGQVNGGDGGGEPGGHDHGDGGDTGGTSSPSPSPSPSPDGGVVGTVTDTVGTVLSLVPTPTPTPTKSSEPEPLVSLPGTGVTLPALPPVP